MSQATLPTGRGREGRVGLGFSARWRRGKAAAATSIGADVKDDGSARGRRREERKLVCSSRSGRGADRVACGRMGWVVDRLGGLLGVEVDLGQGLRSCSTDCSDMVRDNDIARKVRESHESPGKCS